MKSQFEKLIAKEDHWDWEIDLLLSIREKARKVKDWELSDKIRDRLLATSLSEIRDTAEHTEWTRKNIYYPQVRERAIKKFSYYDNRPKPHFELKTLRWELDGKEIADPFTVSIPRYDSTKMKWKDVPILPCWLITINGKIDWEGYSKLMLNIDIRKGNTQ